MRYNLEKFQFAGIEICSSPLIDGHTNEKKSLKIYKSFIIFLPNICNTPPPPPTLPLIDVTPTNLIRNMLKKASCFPIIIIKNTIECTWIKPVKNKLPSNVSLPMQVDNHVIHRFFPFRVCTTILFFENRYICLGC